MTLISLLVALLVLGLIVGLLMWAVSFMTFIPPPFQQGIRAIIAVIAVIILIGILLQLFNVNLGGPIRIGAIGEALRSG